MFNFTKILILFLKGQCPEKSFQTEIVGGRLGNKEATIVYSQCQSAYFYRDMKS